MLKKALIFIACISAFVVTDRCAYRAVDENIAVIVEKTYVSGYWYDCGYWQATDDKGMGYWVACPTYQEPQYAVTVRLPNGKSKTCYFSISTGQTVVVGDAMPVHKIEGRFTKHHYGYNFNE